MKVSGVVALALLGLDVYLTYLGGKLGLVLNENFFLLI